jgi:hypothetical protein
MRWHIECKHSGQGFAAECGLDEALDRAKAMCQADWSCWVVWLLPANLRMAEVGKRGVSWTRSTLSGVELTKLMRRHRKTIGELSFRLGISQKRIRQLRDQGLSDPYAVRDWLEAIVGDDVGPLPERYRIRHWTEEGSCGQCGYPMDTGDHALEYLNDIFCSVACCRQSRGWGREGIT